MTSKINILYKLFLDIIALFIILSLITPLIHHPLPLRIIIIIQTLNLVVSLYKENIEGFPSIILFLLFLGGILILFTYVSSLIPNKIFPKINIVLIILSTILFILILWSTNLFTNLNKNFNLNILTYSVITKLNITIIILLILFFLIINIDFLTNKWIGSLRSSL